MFFPYLQAKMEGVTAYVRTSQDPETVMATIRREMAALDSDLAIFGVTTLDELVDRSVVNERLIANLSATLSVMATLLSVIGLYGVMAYVVARRTREIGIRMALGAVGADIALGVLREAACSSPWDSVPASARRGGSAATWRDSSMASRRQTRRQSRSPRSSSRRLQRSPRFCPPAAPHAWHR